MLRTPHPLLLTIGRTIRALRRERGLSQEALADQASIDRSYMSSIERGLRNLSVLNVSRIATALNVPMRDLLGPREADAALRAPMSDKPIVDMTAALGVPPPVTVRWEPGRYLSLS